jgi:hypothetical protein
MIRSTKNFTKSSATGYPPITGVGAPMNSFEKQRAAELNKSTQEHSKRTNIAARHRSIQAKNTK